MERKSTYKAPFIVGLRVLSKRSDVDHAVLPANYTMLAWQCLPFLRKRSPDGATPN